MGLESSGNVDAANLRMSKSKQTRSPKPTSKAMVICQKTIREWGTSNWSLINVFTHFKTKSFPVTVPPCRLYVQLVNGEGPYELVAEVHDLRTGEMLQRSAMMPVRIASRLEIFHLAIPVPSLTLEHDGRYDIVLLANGEEVDRQQLTLLLVGNQDSDAVDE